MRVPLYLYEQPVINQVHEAWKDSRDQGSDRLYDLDESHLEASSARGVDHQGAPNQSESGE